MKKKIGFLGLVIMMFIVASCGKERECVCMTILEDGGGVESTHEITVKGETCAAHSNTTDYEYYNEYRQRIRAHEVCVEK